MFILEYHGSSYELMVVHRGQKPRTRVFNIEFTWSLAIELYVEQMVGLLNGVVTQRQYISTGHFICVLVAKCGHYNNMGLTVFTPRHSLTHKYQ